MRALVVEDHEATRGLVVAGLRGDGWDVVEAGTVEDAVRVPPSDLDVALIDLRLGGASGLVVVAHFAGAIPCLVLTQSTEGADLVEAFRMGAQGYLLKSDPPPQILAAMRAVLAGGLPLSAGMTHHLLAPLRAAPNPYTLVVDLVANHAELFDPPDRSCSFRSAHAVSLLYTLGARWSLRGPDDAWMPDEAISLAIWGREHRAHGVNNLNVLIHRVRQRARRAGLEHVFLDKMAGSSRLIVGRVVGV